MSVVSLGSDEMKRVCHAKACRSAHGLIPLSPSPLNVVQHFQLAQRVEVVNQEFCLGTHTQELWVRWNIH